MTSARLPPVRPDLDTLLDAALKTGGETEAFDFKELLDLRTDEHQIRLVRAIAAFGNTDVGGHVWIGIADDRRVVGLTAELADLYDQTRVQELVNASLAPPPRVQVRHHERGGKRLVVIEVSPFQEVPSIVRLSRNAGKERLQAGTILFRNASAQSGVLSSELDMRKLCDAVASRKATRIVELVQKGLVGVQGIQAPVARRDGILALRSRGDEFWSSAVGHPPYMEVFFASEQDLALTPEQLRAVIPAAAVPSTHGFPFVDVVGAPTVYTAKPWGWLGVIPFSENPDPSKHPGYLWLLGRDGSFLYRERFWEDEARSVIPGGVGLYHVVGNLVRLVRFLDRFGTAANVPESTRFKLGVVFNNTKGRYMQDEKSPFSLPHSTRSNDTRLEASLPEVSLGSLRGAREQVVINLAEEVAWKFGRDDWKRQKLVETVKLAPQYLGAEHAFPEREA